MGYYFDASYPVIFVAKTRCRLPETHCQKVALLFLGAITVSILLAAPLTTTYAQVVPITPSGLNTHVNLSATPPVGKVQYDITGGSRPGGGPNLFHSFGEFNVPTNNIANFQNTLVNGAFPHTDNILARVTGSSGNNPTLSSIYGTIQTTDFGNANLFLMNPAGFLFGPNATVNVGGMVAFTSADYLKLTDNTRFNAIPNVAADALLTALPVASFGFLGSNPGAITVQGSHFSVTKGQSISLVGSNITIESGTPGGGTAKAAQLSAPNGNILLASAASPGEFDALTLQPLPNVNGSSFNSFGSVTLATGSHIGVSGTNNVSIRGGKFVLLVNDAVLTTSQTPSPPETISLSPGSSIMTSNSGTEPGADIQLIASNVQMDNSIVSTTTAGNGHAGDILMASNSLQVESTLITSSATPLPGLLGGDGGTIHLDITQDAHLSNSTIDSQTVANGKAGDISVEATRLTLNSSSLSTGTTPQSGSTGGNAGDIQVTVGQLTMNDGQIVSQSLFSKGNGGKVTVTATESITTAGSGNLSFAISTSTAGAAPFCPGTCGNAGSITLMAPTVVLNGVGLNSSTTGKGNAGNILAKVGTLTVMNGAQISASAENPGVVTGAGGNITITGLGSPAQSVLIDGPGSGIFTDTQGTGAGGSITVKTTDHVTMTSGASITASSTGPGNAGDISINAGQQLDMRDSAIKTEATKASGGNIDIQAVDRVRLVNSSISTSVPNGTGNGGNITIDPNVVALQNSQIIAQAVQGAGGNITLTTPLFLRDSTSLVSASSQFGVNGTVTIQSPTSNLSESLGTLPSEPSQAHSLLTQRCAALVNGQTSSFVIAGREQLPADPGGWLTSPLTFTALGESLDAGHAFASTPAVMAMATDDTGTVSIRRFTPAGFLMANFADSAATGCSS